MKRLIIGICLLSLPSLLLAETIKKEMHQAFQAFTDLQPYLVDEEKFRSGKNEQKIIELITNLTTSFKDVKNSAGNSFIDDPGFKSSSRAILDVLTDAKRRYKDGDYNWALHQLQNVSANCISCHASFGTNIKFSAPNEGLKNLDLEQQGEYFLATRQFNDAKSVYYKIALNSEEPYKRMEALKRWLMIHTRIDPDPNQIHSLLSAVLKKKDLYPFEKETISDWLESVVAWKVAGRASKKPVAAAEKLLSSALAKRQPLYSNIGTIELLRASSLLHEALNDEKLSSDDRRKALYMLGFTYTKLPGYFIHELPDIFLIKCIREFPKSQEAKSAYKLYTELVRGEYTGSSGIHLPAEVWAKFKELHDIAYGMPSTTL